ncbi:MAG: hypothetical protein K8F52_14615 [Candidatus Scalindua rubra]|uniref:Uncharacterized protein n=1 Tax=Candidatus Scalindua brodae TaxID=237368 RepID=A0A0B0EI64_9BACT|nr:MAG: hypothetical protein SCABRO_01985 [Candidatus Scalindua brodae]MBZ0109883.1 hypothetical protein [Candidatus Scalindua rubra]
MKMLTGQVQQFLVGFVLMFAVFQLSQGIAHAKIYSPVDIKPYDEQSKKILENELKHISTSFSILQNQETHSFAKAFNNYKANPTDENYAIVAEKTGQGLHTKVKTMKDMEKAILKVTPELGKLGDFLKKEGDTEGLEAVELLQSDLVAVREYLKEFIKHYESEAKKFVTSGMIEHTIKDVFPSPEGLQKGIVNGIKDLDNFLKLTIEFNEREKSYLNIENCRQGSDEIRAAIEDSRSKFGY